MSNEHSGSRESTDNEHSRSRTVLDLEPTENESSDENAGFRDDITEKRLEEVVHADEDGHTEPCESKVDFSLQFSQHVQQPKSIGFPGAISASVLI